MSHKSDDRALRRARLRTAIEAGADLNGIDWAESERAPIPGGAPSVILGLFADAPTAPALTAGDFRIEGGDRIRALRVVSVAPEPGDARLLRLQIDRLGDFSTYRIVLDPAPDSFDPLFRAAEVSFRLDCASDVDCEAPSGAAIEEDPGPRIDYLARDFNALVPALFDRLRVTAPQWTERNPADLGVALVEMFAYVGDMLNYRLDAIDAEAYLATCRSRVSARRHARLVDYPMHDGRNARAFVQFAGHGGAGSVPVAARTVVLTDAGAGIGAPRGGVVDQPEAERLVREGAVAFETLHDVTAHAALNRIELHDWGLDRPGPKAGATRTTLRDPGGALIGLLAPGQFLVLEEALGVVTDIAGERSGRRADADPARRWAVRLTAVSASVDPLGDPEAPGPLDVVEIEWDPRDALPFALSSERLRVDDLPATPGPFGSLAARQSAAVARGAIALADEGFWTTQDEPLGGPPPGPAVDPSAPLAAIDPPRRYRPTLARPGVVFAAPYDPGAPGSQSLTPALDRLEPAIRLTDDEPRDWEPRPDLFGSGAEEPAYVAEIGDDGRASLRFGDGRFGLKPEPGRRFEARYRTGRGPAGEVGAETLVWVVDATGNVAGARNPMAAAGALAMESVESVRAKAPGAFREQKRAITAEDYARFAERSALVQRAVATFLWTGAWRTVFVTVDLVGGQALDEEARAAILGHLEPYRRAGHEIALDAPIFAPIEIAMRVCVEPTSFRSDVRERLGELFSRRGLFDPDRWTFGEPVRLSVLYAAAQSVEGVRHVEITTFRRQNDPGSSGLDSGALALERREIAILDNDPNFPGRGVASFEMEGGL